MRQIGVLPDAFQARSLADYLLTLRIETQLIQEPTGWAIWVCDEDRVAQARAEFDTFQETPTDGRYVAKSIDRGGNAELTPHVFREHAVR